ncbi:type VI secretion system Vgr family protein [Acetobacter sp.]|jgi:type VI secretion system secreted protein VgrG|uniref:type VI secretion system Vgr family protein n=1 Tax=Acetobacter sp. TaxID=440 RepID=UPI0025BBC771|nr:type VI secretion system tip protein TssI/VgrG [Acetobacter sp.]MCH4092645.1 type VI secretion system tip protein VgrG [Acetobacter sp.]MCI1299779.1 type VI secretion system tip protein VgrG [Acetobacter sp.]MCI1315341.1 type VI secretion system tip protein VgrG [Acetobacter sp.]
MASVEPLLFTSSPFGDDTLPDQPGTLHATALNAQEMLSQPFQVTLTVVTTLSQLQPDALLYKPFCAIINRKPADNRYFNGIVKRVTPVNSLQRDRWEYQLEIVPRLWFLSQRSDCRIFQKKSVDQILQVLFQEEGVEAYEFRIYGDKPVREYTTQFNETDLDFMHRLLQEEGWFYFFEHTKSEHRLIVTNRNESFKPLASPLHRIVHSGNNIDIIDQWTGGASTAHGEVHFTDYNPSNPTVPVRATQSTSSKTGGASTRRVYRWPALTKDDATAEQRAKHFMEHSEVTSSMCRAHGYDPQFMPGRRFTVERDPLTGEEMVEYAPQAVFHSAVDETWAGQSSGSFYDCSFSCFKQSVPWREPFHNVRPQMTGIYSGVVVGGKGQQIHADPLGRIKVRIVFDHRKDTDAGFATWVRVIQPWAGDSWGWQHLPRVGTEVAVAFMNGDPDEPVVLGGLYNQSMQPVFAVPGEQTKSGFRSRSVHGGASEFSEFSVDDSKGQEKIYLRSQKDLHTVVLNDQQTQIGNDSSATVHRNASLKAETGSVTVEAETEILLKVGDSTIRLTKDGITINGSKIDGTATGNMTLKGAKIRLND